MFYEGSIDEKRKKKTSEEVHVGRFSEIVRRPLCLLLSILIIVAILAAVVNLVLPELGNAIRLLVEGVPEWLKKAMEWCMQYAAEYPFIYDAIMKINIDWETTAKGAFNMPKTIRWFTKPLWNWILTGKQRQRVCLT